MGETLKSPELGEEGAAGRLRRQHSQQVVEGQGAHVGVGADDFSAGKLDAMDFVALDADGLDALAQQDVGAPLL